MLLTAITLLGGLAELWDKNAIFGSFADYTGLVVWAVGLDQGKNLIQALKAYGTPAPQAGGQN